MRETFLLILLMFSTMSIFAEDADFGKKLQDGSIRLSQLAQRGDMEGYRVEAEQIFSPLIKEALAEDDLFLPDSKFRLLLFCKGIQANTPSSFDEELFSSFFKKMKGIDENTGKRAVELCVAFMRRSDVAAPSSCRIVMAYLARRMNDERFYSESAGRGLLEVLRIQDQFTFDGMRLAEMLHLGDDLKLREKLRSIADRFRMDEDSMKDSSGLEALITLARWKEEKYIRKVIDEFSKLDSIERHKLHYMFKMRYLYLIRDAGIVDFLRRELHSGQFAYWGIGRCSQSHAAAIVLYMLLEDYPYVGDIASRGYTEEKKQECIRWFDTGKAYRFREPELEDSMVFLNAAPARKPAAWNDGRKK